MSKKLMYLAMVMLLGLYVGAKADVVVDDFESYMSNSDLSAVWAPDIAYDSTGNSATVQIVPGASSDQAMQVNATYLDGEYVGVKSNAIPQYTAVAGGALHFSIKLDAGESWGDLAYMIVVQAGAGVNPDTKEGADATNWAQTWFLGDTQGYNGWMPISTVPATIGAAAVSPTGGQDWQSLPRITVDAGWVDITIPDTSIVSWSYSSKVSDFDTPVGTLAIEMWGSGNNGQPIQLSYEIDNIYYTPEPATLVLLGLGGLAMLRRKYSH